MSGAAHSSERQAGRIVAGHNNSWLWLLSIAVLSSLTILSVLFVFDPDGNPFYPGCLFHRTTGLLCPGCGSLRALHQILHGHISTAFHYNPMLVIAIPLMIWFGWRILVGKLRQTPVRIAIPGKWVWLIVAVVLAFSIWRNVPGTPFAIPRL